MSSLRERFTQRLLEAWYPADPTRTDWLSIALLDLSWVYRGLSGVRRWLYARGIFESERFALPVVVVGNVIAGGAGKTPVVIELVRHLQARGLAVGVVSRGYGRKSREVVEVRLDTPIQDSGDEPALIHRATGAPVFVSTQRIEAAAQLLAAHPGTQVIVSDDGLQHLRLQRNIEIVVFDARGVGNGRLIPAGPLREPWPRPAQTSLQNAQNPPAPTRLTLHTGGMDGHLIERRLADHALHHDGRRVPLSELKEPVIAAAGIAHPAAFFDGLRALGLQLQETHALPDHYDFDSWSRAFSLGSWLICTEKDAVKLWTRYPEQRERILAVPLLLQLPPDFLTDFDQQINKALSSPHGHQTA